ncbi:MAG: hypothetical protein EP344_06550 [Bacteroidetes bacterium]|nr:MAG: hypothetical protein EP344_06550 [Bacteroidota bacterium]
MRPFLSNIARYSGALSGYFILALLTGCTTHLALPDNTTPTEIVVIGLQDTGMPSSIRFVREKDNWGVVDLNLPRAYLSQVARGFGRRDVSGFPDVRMAFSPDYVTGVLTGTGFGQDSVRVPVGVVFQRDTGHPGQWIFLEDVRHICQAQDCDCCRLLLLPDNRGIKGCTCVAEERKPCAEKPGQWCSHSIQKGY